MLGFCMQCIAAAAGQPFAAARRSSQPFAAACSRSFSSGVLSCSGALVLSFLLVLVLQCISFRGLNFAPLLWCQSLSTRCLIFVTQGSDISVPGE